MRGGPKGPPLHFHDRKDFTMTTSYDLDIMNADRSARCLKALATYNDEYDVLSNLTDFLADAMHWCCFNDHDFENLLSMARHHFLYESMEQQEGQS